MQKNILPDAASPSRAANMNNVDIDEIGWKTIILFFLWYIVFFELNMTIIIFIVTEMNDTIY